MRSSSLPVQIVKVSGSISRSRRRQAVLVAGEIVAAARRCAACRRRPSPCPASSMVSAMTAAPKCLRERQALVGRLLAVLEIDRVDDRLAAVELERRFEHRRLGRVDDQRRVDRAAHAADDLGHLGDLVAADEGGADVERVRAFLDLLAAHLDAAVPVAGFLQLAELLASRWRCSARRSRDRRSPGAAAPGCRARRPTAPRPTCARFGAGREPVAGRCGAASRRAPRYARASVPQQPPIMLTPSSRDEALQPLAPARRGVSG